MIKQAQVISNQRYEEGFNAGLMMDGEKITGEITSIKQQNINGTKCFSFRFQGRWTVAFFPEISGTTGAASDNGEDLTSLYSAVQQFLRPAESGTKKYLSEAREHIRKVNQDPVLAISAECGI